MRVQSVEMAMMLVGTGGEKGPLYRRLATGIAELATRGELPAGCSLPSERDLAAELRLSRTTVVAAYRQLQESGTVERREGSGTRIAFPAGGPKRDTVATGASGSSLATRILHGSAATVDFATAALSGLSMVASTAAEMDLLRYQTLLARNPTYDPRGLLELRSAIAEHYTLEGSPTTEAQILITSGAQQALELVASGCVQPGDPVILEDPAYRGALDAFSRAGCRLEGVACDTGGMVMGGLEQALRSRPARLIYVQSEVQNPTGTSLSTDRRERLLHLAAKSGAIVVDDRSLADTVFGDERSPLMHGSPAVISIGSMNKLYWSGLRLGWIRAESEVIERLAALKGLTDYGTSLLAQQVGIELLGQIHEARRERRADLQRALNTTMSALKDRLPGWTWWEPKGGPSLWVQLPHGDSSQFASVALRCGVAVLPSAVFSARQTVRPSIRLAYALPDQNLRLGIERLAEAWIAFEHHGPIEVPVRSVFT